MDTNNDSLKDNVQERSTSATTSITAARLVFSSRKSEHVTPLLKKSSLDEDHLSTYHPISNLCHSLSYPKSSNALSNFTNRITDC